VSFKDFYDKNRRLALLRFLTEADDYRLNSSVLKTALNAIGLSDGRDIVEADLVLLEKHGLVEIDRIKLPGGEVIVAKLTEPGSEVAKGRPHPVVARPDP